MGQTWNEFRRQCGLAVRVVGFSRRVEIPDGPLTADSLRELAMRLLPKDNYQAKVDDELFRWSELLLDLKSANIASARGVTELVRGHIAYVEEEDRQKAKYRRQELDDFSKRRQWETLERIAQLEKGRFYALCGLIRRCYFRQIEGK